MECIEPFDYNGTVDFKMSFLSGYLAEKYDVTKEEAFPRVKERAVKGATDIFRKSITGYNSVSITGNTLDIRKNKWSHYLMPIWFVSYKYKGEFYHFGINGQTGKFAGNLPVSKAKLALVTAGSVLAANAVIAGIFFGGGLV
jgi:hypothetical protein